jgi:hypothetical protein
MQTEKHSIETWLVDFYNGPTVIDGKEQMPVETVEFKRAYAPTRWAKNHALTLRRRLQGVEVTFSITGL